MKTEKQKMLAGEYFDPLDPELCADRSRARRLTRALNASSDDEVELRTRLLAELLPRAGGRVWIEPPFQCDYGSNIETGERVFFNFDCVVLDVGPVRIGARVMFGPGVHIYTVTHPLDAAERATGLELGRAVEIGDDVWVGGGSIICPGVRIGGRSVIGAGSVVTRDVPEGVFAAGNPCRVIRGLEPNAGRDSSAP
jgi:maltose O-acetyltransferase